MYFNNMYLGDLEYILGGLRGEPSFEPVCLSDKNSLSGKERSRIVFRPNNSMRRLHRRFQVLLLKSDAVFRLLFNSAAKDSIYLNARAHSGNRFFYQTDIKNAFGSVSLDRLTEIILSIHRGWNAGVLHSFLERFFFSPQGGLIIGGPASPLLFNIYAAKVLDEPLEKLWSGPARSVNEMMREIWRRRVYTRYCDDLTFSSPDPIPASLRKKIRQVVKEAGFEVNHRKSTLTDLKKRNVLICGVGLEYRQNKDARIFLPRRYLRRLNGLLYLIVKGKIWVNPQVIDGMWGVIAPCLMKRKENKERQGQDLSRRERELLNLYIRYRQILGRRRVRDWWKNTLWGSQ